MTGVSWRCAKCKASGPIGDYSSDADVLQQMLDSHRMFSPLCKDHDLQIKLPADEGN